MVADSLSRIPGSELLTASELCSMCHTLGVMHANDVPVSLCDAEVAPGAADVSHPSFLHGVISINERDSFRDKLLAEQRACTSAWFSDICKSARNGSAIY